jgi:thiamine-monophosphate kinase
MKNIGSLGEDRLIKRIRESAYEGKDVLAGIGDDCAVTKTPGKKRVTLLKVDCIIQGVHFLADTPPALVGRKAVMRAASDFAAMGGTPTTALVTIGMPQSTAIRWLDSFYKGLNSAMAECGISLVGGESSRTQENHIFAAVTLLGHAPAGQWVSRGGGKPGDVLYVTGVLGGSIRSHHLRFQPRLEEGRWLARQIRPSAMMDLSDGLARDLPRMAEASGTGWRVEPDRLPRRRGCTVEQAATDGEDYELLFAVAPARAEKLEAIWPRRFPKTRLTRIGQLAPKGMSSGLPAGGWDHFSETQAS